MLFKNTNQLKRNYYLNLFSENAEIVKYKNNNHIYNWNIRDLQLGSYAEMALVNINSINDDFTVERQYPPKAYNSFTNTTSTTGELLNILPTTFFKQIITLNTDNITYGSGDYIIYSSTKIPDDYATRKSNLFNYLLNNSGGDIGGMWDANQYNSDGSGNYIGLNYIKNDYYGDWIILKLPIAILLSKYRFYIRDSWSVRAPSLFKFYGSNDGVNFTELVDASNNTNPLTSNDYSTSYYEKIFNNSIKTPFQYIGLVVNKIVGEGTGSILNLHEIQLFGSEKIVRVKQRFSEERVYPPKNYNSYTSATTSTGEIVNINPSTYFKETITLNTTQITYGSGTYEIYTSTTLGGNRFQYLFNKNYLNEFTTAHWAAGQFNSSTSYYNYPTVSNYIVNNFFGDWIVLKLPSPILLTKFRFYSRPTLEGRAPSLWYCHASNDGINWVEIQEASNGSVPAALTENDYSNGYYEKLLNTSSTTTYRYIGFTFNKLVSTGHNILNFNEIELFGKEEIFLLTDERQYPPKLYNSFTNEITGTGEILNVNPLNYIKETVTLNTDDIKYGDGTYMIYSSATTNEASRTRAKLLNFTYTSSSGDTGAYWGFNTYNWTTGYQKNNNYIKSDYFGEWSIIKFPSSFILTKYIIYVDIFLTERWPSLWRFYGSNDGINWTDILEAEVSTPLIVTDYTSYKYEKSININTPYQYIGITFNKIIGNPSSVGTNHLAVQEIQFFGKEIEEEEQTYIIRCSNCYEDGYDSQNNSSAILFMNNRLKTTKNPTYHKIKSYNLNRISLEVSDEIEETNIFKGWDDTIKFGTVFHIKNYKD